MTTPPTFSAGQVLTAAQMNKVGLWLVNTTSFSGVSSVTLPSVFTSDYDNYKIMLSLYGSANYFAVMQMTTGSTPDTSNSYYRQVAYDTASLAASNAGPVGDMYICEYPNVSSAPSGGSYDIFSPYLSQRTTVLGSFFCASTPSMMVGGWQVTTSTSYSGFILKTGSGTISGKVSVYGYRL